MNDEQVIENRDPDSADASLFLPQEEAAVFEPWNWTFSEITPKPSAALGYQAKCRVSGYEKYVYQWHADIRDIQEYGGGTDQGWFNYVKKSFLDTLTARKDIYIQKIKNGKGF